MSKLQYVTAAKDAAADPDKPPTPPTPVTIDGRVYHVSRPEPGDLALLMDALEDVDPNDEDSVEVEHVGALAGFFFRLLSPSDARYLKRRLRSRKDSFGLGSIERIFFDLVEEWSGHPTERSSESSSPPEPTGPTSSADTPTSI